jgi:putative toxin-antitoxin system antitoxin component (TIGR02293 family)
VHLISFIRFRATANSCCGVFSDFMIHMRTETLYRMIPEATYKRRREHLKSEESERTERLARVIATAEYVWDDQKDAQRFLTTAHAQLDGQRPIDIALSELGARRVEELLWKLYYGIAA